MQCSRLFQLRRAVAWTAWFSKTPLPRGNLWLTGWRRAIAGIAAAKRSRRQNGKCAQGFSDLLLRGTMNGQSVNAVYTTEASVPCCVWFSYRPGERMNAERDEKRPVNKTWIEEHMTWIEKPISINLGDAWWTIDATNHPPWPDDKGPLHDGKFVPVKCRTE